MNNLYKRPMFRKGGSAEGGITSGLQRPGYSVGKRVTEVMDEMQSIRPQRNTAKRRLGDLMIDLGTAGTFNGIISEAGIISIPSQSALSVGTISGNGVLESETSASVNLIINAIVVTETCILTLTL